MSTITNRPGPPGDQRTATNRGEAPPTIALDKPGGGLAANGGDPGRASAPPTPMARKASVRWVWNLPLLVSSIILIAVGVPLIVGLYFWQSSRVGDQFLILADRAVAEEKPREEVQWLRRYLSLRPDDVSASVRLALSFDDQASQRAEWDQSRRYLTRALSELGHSDDVVTEAGLRQRLIQRLLQLGGGWFIEAERQLLALNPAPADPQALEQLAKSLLGQAANQVPRPVQNDPPQRNDNFWVWAAAQPIGVVLQLAVEANPDSIELISALIEACLDQPEQFATPDQVVDKDKHIELANRLIQQLNDRQHDGQAQWAALHYANRDDVTVQTQPLAVMAAAALQRLQDRAAAQEGADAVREAGQVTIETAYEPWWDVQIILAQATSLAGGQAFDAAKDHYQALVALPESMLAPLQAEMSFLGLGQALWQSSDSEAARQTWLAGNERVGGNSLTLLEPLAAASAQLSALEEARADVQRLSDAVEAASLRLNATRTSLSHIHRDELQTRLNRANWRVDVLRSHIDYREGDLQRAAQGLERALASQLDIEASARIEASRMLASVYGEQGLWDLAGRVLDAAALLSPADRTLKQAAAIAWHRASAAPRAAEQWKRADDGSFESALAYAGAVAAVLNTKVPANRDLGPALTAIEEAQRRLDRAIAGGDTPAEAWKLPLLKLSLTADAPQARTDADADSDPAAALSPKVQELVELSLQYPDAAQLQAATALTLLQSGETAAAEQALQRLLAVADADQVLVLEVQLRMALEQGGEDDAVRLLKDAVDKDFADRLPMVQFAAGFLSEISRPGEAIELLMKLDDAQHSPQSLLQLGELLLRLRQASPANQADLAERAPAAIDPAVELQKVEATLRKLEGEQGTHWRLLAAQRLLRTPVDDASQIRQRLAQASVLQAEVLSRRPRWAKGLTLSGRIAAEQGDHAKAVELLRQAITEGDKDGTTVLLLVSQLNRLGEVAAAEQELARLQDWNDSVRQVSALSVDLAMGQGKYDIALHRARSGAAARTDDPHAWLIVAQAAAALAQTAVDQSEQLCEEAEDAFERARELTKGRDFAVWQALFRFRLQTGGEAAARTLLQELEQSQMPDSERLLALASGFLALRDWKQAEFWLDHAAETIPSNVNVFIMRANLFQATGNQEAMVQAIENAYRLAPRREDVRRRLALALASSGSVDIPWGRISQLIGTDQRSATQSDQLYHALILINHGDDGQIEQSRDLLRRLIESGDPSVADDAARLLVTVERNRWKSALEDDDKDQAAEALAVCRELYDRLTQRRDPATADLYRYCDLLLQLRLTSEAKVIGDRLASIAPESLPTLELRLRLAKQSQDQVQLVPIVQKWIELPGNRNMPDALPKAAQVLLRLKSYDEAVEMLAKAYKDSGEHFANYVIAVAQAGNIEQAAKLCVEKFRELRSPEPVALMADVLVAGNSVKFTSDDVEQMIAEGLTEFPNNVRLIQSVATLRLTQQRYDEAADLYRRSEKLNPVSMMTLNNLAVTLAELPDGHKEALIHIERAIELYGRIPELLDTLGIVQLRANLHQQAETTLREAYSRSNDQRHLLHLLLALDSQGKSTEVQRLWKELDVRILNAQVLSPSDRKQLDALQKQLEQRGTT